MITRKKVTKEIDVQDKEICDICKKEIRNVNDDESDIEITARIGDRCNGEDYRIGYRLDVCKNCFLDKVKPLLESTFNVEFTEYDCDTFDGFYVDGDDSLFK